MLILFHWLGKETIVRLIDADRLLAAIKVLKKSVCYQENNCQMAINKIEGMIYDSHVIEPLEWIKCEDKMPGEHTSIFAKYKDTPKWDETMFEKYSDPVLAVLAYKKSKTVISAQTIDGKWKFSVMNIPGTKIIAWMPYPEAPKKGEDEWVNDGLFTTKWHPIGEENIKNKRAEDVSKLEKECMADRECFRGAMNELRAIFDYFKENGEKKQEER